MLNKSTGKKLVLSMTSTPNFILWNVDWGVADSSVSSHRYYEQIGESVSSISIGTRQISLFGWIVANKESEMTNLKKYLNSFVSPLQELSLLYKGYVINFFPNSSVAYSTEWKENNDVMSKFEISGTAYDPLFTFENEVRVDAADTDPKWVFPWVISEYPDPPGGFLFGVREESAFFGVLNSGDVNVGMRFIFKANGDVINPSLTNVVTGDFFRIVKEISEGEEVEVCTSVGNKRVIGRNKIDYDIVETNYFKYRDLGSKWLQLSAGDNIFKFNADEGVENLDVLVYFSPKFLEVQECY